MSNELGRMFVATNTDASATNTAVGQRGHATRDAHGKTIRKAIHDGA